MKRTLKRSLAFLLSVLMMLTAAPLVSFAAGEEDKIVCPNEACAKELTAEDLALVMPSDATCTEPGYDKLGYACPDCGTGIAFGKYEAPTMTPATGHTFEAVDADPATCIENGKIAHFVCKVCEKKFLTDADRFSTTYASELELLDLAVGSHDFVEYDPATLDESVAEADYIKTPASCTAKAVYFKRCSVCGEFSEETFIRAEDPEPSHQWDEGVVTEEATCAEGGKNGKKLLTCTVEGCGETKEEVIPAPEGHTYPAADEWTFPEGVDCLTGGKVYQYCTVCGEQIDEKEVPAGQHNYTGGTISPLEPTCTEPGHTAGLQCVVCKAFAPGKEPTILPANGHTMNKIEAEESTCVKNGHDAYYQCKVCENLYLDEAGETPTTLDAVKRNLKDHTPVDVPEVAATCTEAGHAAGYQCSVCNELLGTEEYPALEHVLVAHEVSEPTCAEDGYKVACLRCSRENCGACFTNDEAKTPIATEDAVDPALGHDMVLDQEKSKPATCTEAGREYKVCSRNCGEISDVTLEALNHNFSDEWTIDTPATCMAEGSKSHHCTREGCDAKTDVTKLPIVDHDIVATTIREKTCEEDGEIVYTCSYGCGYSRTETDKATGRHSVDQETGKCTVCNTQVCTCLCHKTEWYYQIIYFIVRAWWQFLGMKGTCECGRVHYTAAQM